MRARSEMSGPWRQWQRLAQGSQGPHRVQRDRQRAAHRAPTSARCRGRPASASAPEPSRRAAGLLKRLVAVKLQIPSMHWPAEPPITSQQHHLIQSMLIHASREDTHGGESARGRQACLHDKCSRKCVCVCGCVSARPLVAASSRYGVAWPATLRGRTSSIEAQRSKAQPHSNITNCSDRSWHSVTSARREDEDGLGSPPPTIVNMKTPELKLQGPSEEHDHGIVPELAEDTRAEDRCIAPQQFRAATACTRRRCSSSGSSNNNKKRNAKWVTPSSYGDSGPIDKSETRPLPMRFSPGRRANDCSLRPVIIAYARRRR